MKYPIILYLNQKYVFDILAIIEDGFSQMHTMKTTESSAADSSQKARGEVGLSNVFAFLGVKLEGEKNNQNKNTSELSSETQKVHTPNSLFARMQSSLDNRELIVKDRILESTTGDFVLFKAKLRKNPIIDDLESLVSIFRLALGFTEDSMQPKQQKNETNKNIKKLEQFDHLVKQLKNEGSIDLIGDSVNETFNAVITIDREYLNDPSLSDIADGEFFVLGKTTRIIKEGSNQSINLLRKTTLSRFTNTALKEMFSGFQSMSQHGLKDSEFITEIEAPVIQVIPIAIYA
ncbi:hypothetical protein GCM10027048_38560 [Hymenobacter coalescens]